jgi:phosphatidylethanolamine-binding protein (PEBP) family uncharacterized protein
LFAIACSGGGGGGGDDQPEAPVVEEVVSETVSATVEEPLAADIAPETPEVPDLPEADKTIMLDSFSLKSPVSNVAAETNVELRFSGLATDDKITIYSDDQCSTKLKDSTVVAENHDVEITLPADGIYKFYATNTSAPTAESDCSSFYIEYTLDRVISPISAVTVASAISNDTTPDVTVSGIDSGDSVYLFTDQNCLLSSQVGFGIAADGPLTITLSSSALASDNTYEFYARSSDVAGNQSLCSSMFAQYELDTLAPSLPSIVELGDGTPATGTLTTPSIKVSGLAVGTNVSVFKDSNCSELVSSAEVTTDPMTLTSDELTVDGIYNFYANSSDAAGNNSSCSSSSATYSLDASVPSLTLVSISAGGLAQAAVNGEATIEITSTEPLTNMLVQISGQTAVVSNTAPNQYQAKYTFLSGDASANPVLFSINYEDSVGNGGTPVTSTTDSSSLAYDNTNFSPQLSLTDYAINETANLIFDINDSGSGSDVDAGSEALTYSCYYDLNLDSSVANALGCNLLGISLNPSTGEFSWVPSYEQAGDYEIKVVSSDGVFKAESVFNVSVANVNRAPAISNQGNRSLSENETFTKDFKDTNTNTDNDVDGDIITYSCYYDDNIDGIVGTANNCSEISGLNFNEVNGLFSWAVKPSNVGIYDIKVVASDGDLTSEMIFKVTVTVDISKQPQLSMVGSAVTSYFSSLSDDNEVSVGGNSQGIKNAGDTFTVTTSAGDLLECSGGCFAITPEDGTAAWSTKTYASTLLSTYIGREPNIKVVVAAFDNAAYVEIKQNGSTLDSGSVAANSIRTFSGLNPSFEALVIESDQDVSAYVSSGSSTYDKDGRVITAASKQSLGFVSGGGGTPSGITTTANGTTVNAYRADGTNFLAQNIDIVDVLAVTHTSATQNAWESAIAIYSDEPTVSTQHADGDGNNATPSLPKSMLSTHFVTPMEGDYVSFAAYDEANVIVVDASNNVIDKIEMIKDASADPLAPYAISYNPAAAIATGTRFICSEPCLAIFEPDLNDDETLMTGALNEFFTASSDDFANDSTISSDFEGNQGSCSGQNSFPHLAWDHLPWGAKSLTLIVENSTQGVVHLNLYNIDPATLEISQLSSGASFPSGSLGSNGFGVSGWTGVCNSAVDDNYTFKLYALKSDLPGSISNMSSSDFESTYDAYIVDVSTLTVKF